MATLTFRTISQAVLFQHEMKAQLSDGLWENCGHDYRPWWEADVKVGSLVGRNFSAIYDSWDFCSRDLLGVVGQRMMSYVRIALSFGTAAVEPLSGLLDLHGAYCGMPTETDEYHQEKAADIAAYLAENDIEADDVKDVVNFDGVYGRKELLADLREMKQTIKIRL